MRHWPIVKTVAFIILVQGAVLVYLPVFVLEERGALKMPALSVLTVFAAVLWAFAVWVCISCAIRFALEGKGTPAPVDPPRILVVRGIYRFTRNPMYVGVVSALLAEALFFSQAALAFVALLCFMGFHLFVILYEEPHLRRVFGPQYEEYCRKVPRWAPLLGKWNRSRVAR
ncbi:MAG TPA: isoprenylcysteine carboxylmethyltransferase family protein [Bacteroidota bacterium]|nr:isoprenylcysteine carboxylmethyltransferase family protein [Bacteroidota bacterium]